MPKWQVFGGIEDDGFKLDKRPVSTVGQARLRIYSSLGSVFLFFAAGEFYFYFIVSSLPFFF